MATPLLSAVLAAVFYRERLTPRVCGALGLAGVALVVLGSGKCWARPAGAMPWSSWRWWCSCAAGW